MSKLFQYILSEITENFDNIRVPLSAKQRETIQKKYPYYGAQNVIDYVDDYLFDGEYILVAEDGENLKSQKAKVCNLVKGKFWVNNHAHIIQGKKGNNTKYIYYYLNLIDFKPFITGSAQPKLTKENLNSIPVKIHNITGQEKIASVLSTLDAKIELNNKINTELEAMAKTLYDYWFVQFDFPDENGKPYKSSGGEMVWSEELKREIPKGWEVKKISELIAEDKSGDWGKDEKTGNYTQEVFCIRGADINGLNGKEQSEPPKRFILKKNGHKLLKPYDLIVEISGGSPTQSTGRIAHISTTTAKRFSSPLICSNFCKALSLNDYKLTYNFHFFWNRLYDNKVFFGYEGKTSGIKNFLFDSFTNTNFMIIPSDEMRNKFFDIMENVEEKRQKILKENQELAELRDFLLPMLMNGQVVVT